MKKNLLFVFGLLLGTVTYAQCDIVGVTGAFCIEDAPVALTIASPGAVWSGPGMSGNIFNPVDAGVGTHEISVTAPGEGYAQGNIPFDPTPIVGGTTVGGLSDDNVVGTFPIGFTFNFFGNDYTSFYVGSNGFVTFSSGMPSGCCSGQLLPNPGTPNNLIAFPWNDLYPPAGGSVKYQTIGTAPNRILIVDFTSIGHCCSMIDPVTSQIKIFESSNCVQVHLTSQPRTYGNHTVGIENATGSEGYAPPGKNATSWTATNFGYEFCPNVGCSNSIMVEVVAGPVVDGTVSDNDICFGDEITLDVTGTADSYLFGAGIIPGVPFVPATSGLNVFIINGVDDATGCTTSDAVNVMVNPIPSVSAGEDKQVCENEEFTLNAIGSDADYEWDNGAVDGVPMMQDAGTVTYTVTATNSGGCENTSSVEVESFEAPSGTAIVNYMTGVGYDGSIDFTPTGGTGGPYEFSWSNGATTEDISGLGVGTYTVTVSDEFCSSTITYIVDSQAGIALEELDNLSVYPNPVVENFTIDFEGTYNWILFDNTGKIVSSGQATNIEVVSMADLADGNYLLKVAVDGKESVVSLVKE